MGYILDSNDMNQVLEILKKEYLIYAPKVFCGGGRLSDTICEKVNMWYNSFDDLPLYAVIPVYNVLTTLLYR